MCPNCKTTPSKEPYSPYCSESCAYEGDDVSFPYYHHNLFGIDINGSTPFIVNYANIIGSWSPVKAHINSYTLAHIGIVKPSIIWEAQGCNSIHKPKFENRDEALRYLVALSFCDKCKEPTLISDCDLH